MFFQILSKLVLLPKRKEIQRTTITRGSLHAECEGLQASNFVYMFSFELNDKQPNKNMKKIIL